MPYPYFNSDPVIDFSVLASDNKWIPFWAYIDSGAYISVLTSKDAQDLGLSLHSGQKTELHGIGGKVSAYIHRLSIRLNNQELITPIAFSTSNSTPRLLGRQGIFDKFTICFDEKHKLINFS